MISWVEKPLIQNENVNFYLIKSASMSKGLVEDYSNSSA